MTKYKKQICAFFTTSIGISVLYMTILLFYVHILHLPLKNAEPWLDNLYKVKDYINANSNGKRLIIISGSNSLFGFDSSLIAKHTKYQPINYATHAGIPINYHIDKIIANAKNGDIIFMPLEFEYYTRNNQKDDMWYISNMLLWGNGYKKYISIKGLFLTHFSDSPFATIKRIIKHKKPNINENPIDEMLKVWDKNANNPCGESISYSYKSLSPYGDFCAQENKEPYIVDADYKSNLNLKISQFFLDEFARLKTFADEHNIKIFLTYPPTAENEKFSIKNPKTHKYIANLKAQLAKNKIKIYGDFRDFHFEQKYFYDTPYHLNNQGAILRTQQFIELLDKLEKSGEI